MSSRSSSSAPIALTVSMPLIASRWRDWYFAKDSSSESKHRAQPPRGVAHERDVERRRRQVDERQRHAVDEHQDHCDQHLGARREPLHGLLHDELPHLGHARQAPLDVADAARVEVAHGERQQLSRDLRDADVPCLAPYSTRYTMRERFSPCAMRRTSFEEGRQAATCPRRGPSPPYCYDSHKPFPAR